MNNLSLDIEYSILTYEMSKSFVDDMYFMEDGNQSSVLQTMIEAIRNFIKKLTSLFTKGGNDSMENQMKEIANELPNEKIEMEIDPKKQLKEFEDIWKKQEAIIMKLNGTHLNVDVKITNAMEQKKKKPLISKSTIAKAVLTVSALVATYFGAKKLQSEISKKVDQVMEPITKAKELPKEVVDVAKETIKDIRETTTGVGGLMKDIHKSINGLKTGSSRKGPILKGKKQEDSKPKRTGPKPEFGKVYDKVVDAYFKDTDVLTKAKGINKRQLMVLSKPEREVYLNSMIGDKYAKRSKSMLNRIDKILSEYE